MPEREVHISTPEEREQNRLRRERAIAEIPEFLARAERREQALREQSVSGQLRRAIAESRLPYQILSKQSGVELVALADFMTGDAPLDSAAFARLAAALGYELVPVGSHVAR